MKYCPSLLLFIITKERFFQSGGVGKTESHPNLIPSSQNHALWQTSSPSTSSRCLAGADRDGKFHVATLSGLVRGCGQSSGSPPAVCVESCPWGSARLHQTVVCTLSFCSKLPPKGGDGDAGGVQAGQETQRRSVVLPVIQCQGMIVSAHQCRRCRGITA